jgi:uncharacterized protein with FMN-binding domain
MTIGIVLAVLFILEVANIFCKKINYPNVRKVIKIGHKMIGILFLIMAALHMIIVLPLIKQRPITIYILGFVMVGCAVILLFSYVFRKKFKQHWITIHRIAALVIGICLVLHIYVGITSLNRYKQLIEGIKIENVDVTNLPDGTYIGDCDAGYIYAKVEVQVKAGTITAIELLEHRTERGKPAEVITDKMVQAHNVKVDAITGATNSSKVIMKATENALEQKKTVD